ncbi:MULTISPECIES: hypothetical protein [unclassified Mycobacterium]|uniref:hypothetical protein n=1 Tax=unclassified Mycobacterium TaxID=2642494 RepID=UPI0029C7D985|nr:MULTISPECIES: hypothetical protein [unclassified Mycobacterium]
MDFKVNKDGMSELQRQLEEQFSAGVQVSLGGSEEDAIQSIKDQIVGMGAIPNDAEVKQLVRNVRNL